MGKPNPLNLANLAAEKKQKDYQNKIKDISTELLDKLDSENYTWIDMINILGYMQKTIEINAQQMRLKDIFNNSK